jgi:acyl-CoA thioester hydrolase
VDHQWLTRIKVPFRDVDMMGHVNNAVYLSYMEQARGDAWEAWFGHGAYHRMPYLVGEAHIRYTAPAHLRDTIEVGTRLTAVGRRTYTLEYLFRRASDQTQLALASTVLVFLDLTTMKSVDTPEEFKAKALEFGVPT